MFEKIICQLKSSAIFSAMMNVSDEWPSILPCVGRGIIQEMNSNRMEQKKGHHFLDQFFALDVVYLVSTLPNETTKIGSYHWLLTNFCHSKSGF